MPLLAEIALDMWLLSQRPEGKACPDGYRFQAAVADALSRPGTRYVQRAGLHTLWGIPAASGAAHELDAAAQAPGSAYLVEAKATNEVSKTDIAVFELKLTDYYFGRWERAGNHAWFPLLAAAGAVSESARRLAIHRSIILCDYARLPLPVLYHHASHPTTLGKLPEDMRREMMRLAPRAIAPLQQRYLARQDLGGLLLRPMPYTSDEIDDLVFLQDEFTDNVLDRYDRLAPGRLEARAARLQRRLWPVLTMAATRPVLSA
jgi:hypothetical protein